MEQISRDAATGHVLHLVQNFLNLAQAALKEVLEKEIAAEAMSRDHARDIFNATGALAVQWANDAMAIAAEAELAETKAVEPKRPAIFLPDGYGQKEPEGLSPTGKGWTQS